MSLNKTELLLVAVVLLGSLLTFSCYRTADDDDGAPSGDDDTGDDDQNTNDDDAAAAPRIPHGEQGNCATCHANAHEGNPPSEDCLSCHQYQ